MDEQPLRLHDEHGTVLSHLSLRRRHSAQDMAPLARLNSCSCALAVRSLSSGRGRELVGMALKTGHSASKDEQCWLEQQGGAEVRRGSSTVVVTTDGRPIHAPAQNCVWASYRRRGRQLQAFRLSCQTHHCRSSFLLVLRLTDRTYLMHQKRVNVQYYHSPCNLFRAHLRTVLGSFYVIQFATRAEKSRAHARSRRQIHEWMGTSRPQVAPIWVTLIRALASKREICVVSPNLRAAFACHPTL